MYTSCSTVKYTNSLVILLHAGRSHAIDDRVTAGIHVADCVANGKQCEDHDDTEPQNDVEHHRVGFLVVFGKVEFFTLFKTKKRNSFREIQYSKYWKNTQ